MFRILFGLESLLELVVVDEIAAILDHKIAHFDIGFGFKTPAFSAGIENVERRVRFLLEPLIDALGAASFWTALNQQDPN